MGRPERTDDLLDLLAPGSPGSGRPEGPAAPPGDPPAAPVPVGVGPQADPDELDRTIVATFPAPGWEAGA